MSVPEDQMSLLVPYRARSVTPEMLLEAQQADGVAEANALNGSAPSFASTLGQMAGALVPALFGGSSAMGYAAPGIRSGLEMAQKYELAQQAARQRAADLIYSKTSNRLQALRQIQSKEMDAEADDRFQTAKFNAGQAGQNQRAAARNALTERQIGISQGQLDIAKKQLENGQITGEQLAVLFPNSTPEQRNAMIQKGTWPTSAISAVGSALDEDKRPPSQAEVDGATNDAVKNLINATPEDIEQVRTSFASAKNGAELSRMKQSVISSGRLGLSVMKAKADQAGAIIKLAESNPTLKSANESISAANNIIALLQSPSGVSFGQLKASMTKLGEGNGARVSNQDVKMYLPENLRNVGIQAVNYLNGGSNDPMTQPQKDAIIAILEKKMGVIKQQTDSIFERISTNASKIAPLLSEAERKEQIAAFVGDVQRRSAIGTEEQQGPLQKIQALSNEIAEMEARKAAETQRR